LTINNVLETVITKIKLRSEVYTVKSKRKLIRALTSLSCSCLQHIIRHYDSYNLSKILTNPTKNQQRKMTTNTELQNILSQFHGRKQEMKNKGLNWQQSLDVCISDAS
jgi:hypothetical protein